MASPLLIPLPHGLGLGGVTTWALRLANGLSARGRECGLILHSEPPGQHPVDAHLHPGVRVFRLDGPPLGDRPGDLSPYLPVYQRALEALARAGEPVAIAPSLHGDCFGLAAALTQIDAKAVRVLGWQHSDNEYDARVLSHYEPIISKFVPVSDRLDATLRARLPTRATDILNIACGVEVPSVAPLRSGRAGQALRIVYAGRLEHQPKRILALIHMSDELNRRGVAHVLKAIGDGDAGAEFDALASMRPCIEHLPPTNPEGVRAVLAESDVFVLASRYEGLSVSMLEAMAAGCIPVLARTDSGALQVIEPGTNGEIADVSGEADDKETGIAMADAVARLTRRDAGAMSHAAWRTVRDRYSLDLHLDRVSALIDDAAAGPARAWAEDRRCAFTAAPGAVGGSGSVPADGPVRLENLLRSLAGRRILLHGSGQHTIQLGPVLAGSPARILGITDDDRQRAGSRVLDYPVMTPDQAGSTGATDIIISSWMHQDAIYARRQVYEAQGLRVHRIYAT